MQPVERRDRPALVSAEFGSLVPVSAVKGTPEALRAECTALFTDLANALRDDPGALGDYLPHQLLPAIDACRVFAISVSSVPGTAGGVHAACAALFTDLANALKNEPSTLHRYSPEQLQAAIDACRAFAIPVAELTIIGTTAPVKLGTVGYLPPVFQDASGKAFCPPYGLYGAHLIAPQQVEPKRLAKWAMPSNWEAVDFRRIETPITGQPDHCLWQDSQGCIHYQPAQTADRAIKGIRDNALTEARQLLEEGDAREALHRAELAFSADPSDDAYMVTALCHLRLGELDLADETLWLWENARACDARQPIAQAERAVSEGAPVGAYMKKAYSQLLDDRPDLAGETLMEWENAQKNRKK